MRVYFTKIILRSFAGLAFVINRVHEILLPIHFNLAMPRPPGIKFYHKTSKGCYFKQTLMQLRNTDKENFM